MASSVEKETHKVFSLELPAPSGWKKKVSFSLYNSLSLSLSQHAYVLFSFCDVNFICFFELNSRYVQFWRIVWFCG